MSSISIKFHKILLQWNCCPDRSHIQATPLLCSTNHTNQSRFFYYSGTVFKSVFQSATALWMFISPRACSQHDFWTHWPNLDKLNKRAEAVTVLNSCDFDEKRCLGKKSLLLNGSLKGCDLTIRYNSPTSNHPLLRKKACLQCSWATFPLEEGNVHIFVLKRLRWETVAKIPRSEVALWCLCN